MLTVIEQNKSLADGETGLHKGVPFRDTVLFEAGNITVSQVFQSQYNEPIETKYLRERELLFFQHFREYGKVWGCEI